MSMTSDHARACRLPGESAQSAALHSQRRATGAQLAQLAPACVGQAIAHLEPSYLSACITAAAEQGHTLEGWAAAAEARRA
jgi:hypothetical protein